MKRTANCIRMLLLLKARGFLTREELAKLLHTNIRNITEYRKELEEAGYHIVATTGKYGGLSLSSSALFPVIGLRTEEIEAIQEAIRYMKSHDDFLMQPSFLQAMDKLMATTNMTVSEGGIYMQGNTPLLDAQMKEFIQRMETARKDQLVVDILYKGMYDTRFEKVRIHPYEILNDKGSYYCLAYSLKAKAYRHFKFSTERMKQVQLTQLRFQRDADFQVEKHIGKKGLLHDDVYAIELRLYGETALLVSENMPGIDPQGEWMDAHCFRLITHMEGHLPTLSYLLSLGDQAELLEPRSLREEIKEIAGAMLNRYSQESSSQAE